MRLILTIAALLCATAAQAETPRDFLTRFEKEAGSAASAERGARFFTTKQGGEWSCASCHTERPTQAGRHAKTDKAITPLAPAFNGQRLSDGRYFQVTEGAHELQARFQFEVSGGGGLDGISEPRQVTCEIRVRYDNFIAAQRYRLEARPLQMKAQAWLYDEQRNLLAHGKVVRCGTF